MKGANTSSVLLFNTPLFYFKTFSDLQNLTVYQRTHKTAAAASVPRRAGKSRHIVAAAAEVEAEEKEWKKKVGQMGRSSRMSISGLPIETTNAAAAAEAAEHSENKVPRVSGSRHTEAHVTQWRPLRLEH